MAKLRTPKARLAAIVATVGLVLMQSRGVDAAPAIALPAVQSQAAPSTKTSAPPVAASEDADEFVAPDSPRASVEAYLQLCKQARYQEAARYLSVPPAQAKRAAQLARRLKAVLDRHFSIDSDALSPKSEGTMGDQLGLAYEQIGKATGSGGKVGPLRLIQKGYPGPDARWIFSRSTVERIDEWYDGLEQRWFLEHLPKVLLRVGPRDLLMWQWAALPVLVVVCWLLGIPLGRASRRVLFRLAKRTETTWDDSLVESLGGPLTLAWMLLLTYVALPWLGLHLLADEFAKGILRGGLLFTFFWVLSRLIDVWGTVIKSSEWGNAHSASTSLVPLGVRVGKIAVLVIAIIALVSSSGYPVGSLLAGLGVGGLALALAAQKTVENLFGAFSMGADQPFRVGDFIKVDTITGTVESIGLRSTRIRTPERTLISIPNGKLSEMRIESYALRDRFLLHCMIGLVYDTTPQQMRQVLGELERQLLNHPKIWNENLVVRFCELGASALNIEVMAWFLTSDFSEFQAVRQEVLLGFMDCVKNAGTAFAFSTQAVHIQPGSKSAQT